MSTPTRWSPRTLADEQPDAPPARCICGRMVPADMMVDVRALPAGLRTGHGRGERRTQAVDHLCDACRARMVAERRIGHAALAQALGAPAAVVAKAMRMEGGPRATA